MAGVSAGRQMAMGDQGSRRSERRWAQRYRFRADLEIEWGSAVLRGSTRDISSSGMFIESADTLWVGAGFSARLVIERPVTLNCSVKRVEPGRGMGVTVAISETENQQRFQDLLSRLSHGEAS
ncbi:MAG TPA: PilZ domain-containing protein [Candidatus Acidoferrum sp.]|nr:PilZ domain-containing protein [Candidatus Acidoferrum sp.]